MYNLNNLLIIIEHTNDKKIKTCFCIYIYTRNVETNVIRPNQNIF